ncbi:hypothetical protein [Haloquadratum walsbyi]|jgi:hypothetical protein|uniref:hypothetical protein n=1 Tax=Haloquadratum walsbyi TaxID=293091 RepID=UPI0023EF57C1|nr:hypothetical protein [Haloquadratum walsbyi]
MSDTDTTTYVELPTDVVTRVEDRLSRTEWETPDEYITYVVKEVLSQVETELGSADNDDVTEEEVRSRLKDLGYLNE